MKETAAWIAALILGLLTPVQEYVLACEFLIVMNWLASKYTTNTAKQKQKKRAPVYAQIFFVMVAIVATNQIDKHILKTNALSYPLSLGLVIFEFNELQKSISEILGIDITKFTNTKTKNKKQK